MSSPQLRLAAYNNHNHNNPVCPYIHTAYTNLNWWITAVVYGILIIEKVIVIQKYLDQSF